MDRRCLYVILMLEGLAISAVTGANSEADENAVDSPNYYYDTPDPVYLPSEKLYNQPQAPTVIYLPQPSPYTASQTPVNTNVIPQPRSYFAQKQTYYQNPKPASTYLQQITQLQQQQQRKQQQQQQQQQQRQQQLQQLQNVNTNAASLCGANACAVGTVCRVVQLCTMCSPLAVCIRPGTLPAEVGEPRQENVRRDTLQGYTWWPAH
ncbi:alpha/beta-gliadin MM1-like [Aplysia californica]|uniref:Alpha/beta-gliadin MM1-like n=1 Tax=Aplysia californica TaxID=6500 RepID=A0ABM1VSL6_APLCA|nr:alpha/beta-gliadin MM1-like [Aplysia californica]